jgi:hypothetical protein
MRVSSIVLCVLAVIGLSAPAMRASGEDLAAARRCSAILDATARLACFDQAFAVAPKPREQQFGDNDHLQQQRTPKVDLPKSIELIVKRAAPLGQGLYRLTLDNGQVWETRQADWTLVFQTSDTITISRLPLGGYQISKPGKGKSVGAKRIE